MNTVISVGNSKLGKIPNVSLLPALACHNVPCKKECYAHKFTLIWPNVAKAWHSNYMLASKDRTTYFGDIIKYLRKHETKVFRWHTAGDILDQNYLSMMYVIARCFPKTKFLAFTKKHGLNFSNKPTNMAIVFSMWKSWGNTKKPFPRAYMLDKKNPDTRIPKNVKHCKNDCSKCFLCWNLKKDQSIVFEKH